MVGAEVEAPIRGSIASEDAALALNGFGGEVVAPEQADIVADPTLRDGVGG